MKSALLLAGCVVIACFISTEALNKDETIMKAYLADQAEHKTEEMVEAPPPVDNHVYTKFPSWVETEDDMEAFFKQQKTKVIRKNTGKVQKKKKAAAPELAMLQKFPAWIESEEDMEAYFKDQHTKVIRRDTGNGGVNPSGNPTIEAELVQDYAPESPEKKRREDKYQKQEKDDPLAWANLEQVSKKPKQDLVHNTLTDTIAEENKTDLEAPKENSWDHSSILGGEQKRIDDSERRRLMEENYDDEDELIQDLISEKAGSPGWEAAQSVNTNTEAPEAHGLVGNRFFNH